MSNGPPPSQYGKQTVKELTRALNEVSTGLYGEIVKSTPVGVGGRLQRSWTFSPASVSNPQATIGTNSQYMLAVEMGRKPGKGISKEGQASVALWAQRKLSKKPQDAKSLAYLLSEKYKRMGREAQGNIGLARPGSMGQPVPTSLDQTVPGSILHKAAKDLESRINSIQI